MAPFFYRLLNQVTTTTTTTTTSTTTTTTTTSTTAPPTSTTTTTTTTFAPGYYCVTDGVDNYCIDAGSINTQNFTVVSGPYATFELCAGNCSGVTTTTTSTTSTSTTLAPTTYSPGSSTTFPP